MGLQNSKIMICKNVKLEKDYKDVLDYTEANMVTLCTTKAVASASDYSFIRKEKNTIQTSFAYSDALKCNYMAFQNTDYDSKWFFAFIDDVEYSNDGTARIKYTVDEFSTWYDYWNPQACFVEREHVNNDTIGYNTIPEGIEFGDYVINTTGKVTTTLDSNLYIAMGTTKLPSNTPGVTGYKMYGKVYSGVTYLMFQNTESATKFVKAIDSMGQDSSSLILNVCTVPMKMFWNQFGDITWYTGDLGSETGISFTPLPNMTTKTLDTVTFSSPSALDGYSPKNNKLLCYPYNVFHISNNAGIEGEFRYEDFTNLAPVFNVVGTFSPSCSIMCFPTNYKRDSYDNSGYKYGIPVAKYPQGSWNSDNYTNWLVQNGVNILGQRIDAPTSHAIAGSLQAFTGAVTKQYDSVGAGFGTMLGAVQEMYRASLTPNTVNGQINQGDLTCAIGKMSPTYYKMTIKQEYARMIDDFFSKFGYKINRLKLPNQVGRQNWNYVKIGVTENIGYSTNSNRSVPSASMEIINNIYRNGVTIWHSHDNLGNYSLSNNIVT